MVTVNTFNRRPDGSFESLDVSGTTTTNALEADSAQADDATFQNIENKIRETDLDAVNRSATSILEHAFDLAPGEFHTFFELQKTGGNEAASGFSEVTSRRESNASGFEESGPFAIYVGGSTWGPAGETLTQITSNVRLQIDDVDASILKYQIRPTDDFHNTACRVLVSGRPQPVLTDPSA